MKTAAKFIACLAILAVSIGFAHAQFAEPDDAIGYRKAVMTLIVHHFKAMGAVAQGKAAYDKETFAENAGLLKILATLPWEASMVPGSDKGNTTLNAEVFKDPDAFQKAAAAFEAGTAKLAELAAAGDLEGAKAQFGAVAGSCKECHTKFRTK